MADNKLIDLEGLGIVYTELKNQISEYLTVEDLNNLKADPLDGGVSLGYHFGLDDIELTNRSSKDVTMFILYKGMVEPNLTESPLDTDIANIKTQYHIRATIPANYYTTVTLSTSLETSLHEVYLANSYQGWFVYQAFADDGSYSELSKTFLKNGYL